MFEVRYKFPDRTYNIYDKAEADKEGIRYSHWRWAEAGTWAISDDDFVYPVLRHDVTDYLGRGGKQAASKAHLYVTPFGRFKWIEMYQNTKYKVRGRSKNDPEVIARKIKNKFSGDTFKDLAMVYAQLWDTEATIELVCPDKTYEQRKSLSKRMSHHVFKEMVMKEVKDLLEEHKMGREFVVELLGLAVEMAVKKADARTILAIAQNLQALNGMDEKTKSIERTTLAMRAMTTGLIQRAGEEERMIEVTNTREINGGTWNQEGAGESEGNGEDGLGGDSPEEVLPEEEGGTD